MRSYRLWTRPAFQDSWWESSRVWSPACRISGWALLRVQISPTPIFVRSVLYTLNPCNAVHYLSISLCLLICSRRVPVWACPLPSPGLHNCILAGNVAQVDGFGPARLREKPLEHLRRAHRAYQPGGPGPGAGPSRIRTGRGWGPQCSQDVSFGKSRNRNHILWVTIIEQLFARTPLWGKRKDREKRKRKQNENKNENKTKTKPQLQSGNTRKPSPVRELNFPLGTNLTSDFSQKELGPRRSISRVCFAIHRCFNPGRLPAIPNHTTSLPF